MADKPVIEPNIYDPEFYIIWAIGSYPEGYGPRALQLSEHLFERYKKLFMKMRDAFRDNGTDGVIDLMTSIDEKTFRLFEEYNREFITPSDWSFERSIAELRSRAWKRAVEEEFEKLKNGTITLEDFTKFVRDIDAAIENPKLTLKDMEEELLKDDSSEALKLPIIGLPTYPSDIVLITAKTKAGKTTLALNIALKLLQREEEMDLSKEGEFRPARKVMYITYEIATAQLFKILVGIAKGKNWKETTKQDKEEFIKRYGENISIQFGLDLEKLISYVWAFHPDVFIIDYDQLVPTKGRFESEERRVAYIVRSLKDVATQTGSVCILLSQVNEDGQARYSREKEHAASIHIHLERDDNNEELIHYEVKLNRWGRAGDKGILSVNWDNRQMNITDSSANPWLGAMA